MNPLLAFVLLAMAGGVTRFLGGMNPFILLGIMVLIGFVASKLLDAKRQPFVPAIAIQSTHILGFLLVALMIKQLSVFSDVIILSAGLAWLLIRPGLGPVVVLTIVQVLGIGVNLFNMWFAGFPALTQRQIGVHVVLRIVTIVFLWIGLNRFKDGVTKKNLAQPGEHLVCK